MSGKIVMRLSPPDNDDEWDICGYHGVGRYPIYVKKDTNMSMKDAQVGGEHYKLPIQPIDFIIKNDIPFVEANVIKYVVRHRQKNGKEDIEKAIHYLQMLLETYE